VFQRYALFPHLNVFENVAFGLRIKKTPEKEIWEQVKRMLALVDLKGYEKRPVSKLSGGQQQRVAIARALVNMPHLLLLDEPLGALDLKLRKDMQLELKRMQQQAKITFLYVTHDQEEALTMSDVIVVMKSGTIQQIGSPHDIYNEPANAFVADFIGESNIVDAEMYQSFIAQACGVVFPCVDARFEDTELVDMVIRPEDIEVLPAGQGLIDGVVEAAVFKGVHYEMTIHTADNSYWLIHSTHSAKVGETIGMYVAPENIHIMRRMFPTSDNRLTGVIKWIENEECGVVVNDIEYVWAYEEEKFFSAKEGDSVLFSLSPRDITVLAADDGDFNAYMDSVIYKISRYEMIAYADENRYLIHAEYDEQVGTTVGIRLRMEKAIPLRRIEAREEEK